MTGTHRADRTGPRVQHTGAVPVLYRTRRTPRVGEESSGVPPSSPAGGLREGVAPRSPRSSDPAQPPISSAVRSGR
jgi:hypothetical protein